MAWLVPSLPTWSRFADDEHAYLYVLRVLIVSFLKGTAPIMAVEVAQARRARVMCGLHSKKWNRHAATGR